ncbi:ATP-dependent DNA helicase RuvA [Eubacterium ramulus]|jgi:Holliday junction DNA helicase RuvA|uniref:Holliday junction branch migration complex subunit RuvA n=2 Tax=Bacillota TaxID=1239 RepID=A0A2V1JL44_EUBRA|nr:ATP-dependent DNA helicase RuvA [Eubacterium ramulus]RHV70773.1 Holliday junction branch migration protein RuvA [Roseburia sp. OM02-15]
MEFLMYSYIKGTLEEVSEDLIVVENNGIGYNIRISARMLDALPARGEQVKIYTYLYVKEDAFSLFGFPSRDELEMFKLLINVSGIGPKGGLAVLSVLSANDLRFAIVAEDAKTISKAPGIGSKTAKRLIIELKDKIDLEAAIETGFEEMETPAAGGNSNNRIRKEASEALVALGYSATEASKVLSGIEITEVDDVESVLKAALKNMALF